MSNKLADLESVFNAAVEIDCPKSRAAFVVEHCGSDLEKRRQLERLLAAHFGAGSFLHSPPPASAATVDQEPVTEQAGTVIGPYKLMEQIGEGGMGLVFMAEQRQPVRRLVALKVIKPGMDTRQVIARFEAERQALAVMDHPNIARVLDAGAAESGRPYFVMELVRGVPITRFCDDGRLTTRQRLDLFMQVCHAVQHAHQKGVIHRDLKPSNVMVAMHDDKPVVKIIDFGVAKAMGQQLTDKTLVTGFVQMVGTPLYMSPEQATLSALDIDTRSDIYALGVLLYELLTGTTPFDKERFRVAAYDEVRRVIREEEPPRPSTRISTLGQAAVTFSDRRKSDPKRLRQFLRGDLDWIVMKCLEKDRGRRYQTANALAMDIQRYLNDQPVEAGPPSGWYRFRKFAKRHTAQLAVASLVLFFIIVLGSGAGWAMRDRAAQAAEHVRAMQEAEDKNRERQERDSAVSLRVTEQGVNAALTEAKQLQAIRKISDAFAKVKQAKAILDTGIATTELKNSVQSRLDDLKMLVELEDIRSQRVNAYSYEGFDNVQIGQNYARCFRDHGVDMEVLSPEEAAKRIGERSVAVELAATLDDWAMMPKGKKTKNTQGVPPSTLLRVARAVDPDPSRNNLRAALEQADAKALKDLLKLVRIEELSPATLVVFAAALRSRDSEPEAVELLRQAQRRHPNEFWINYFLAAYLQSDKSSNYPDSIAFGRVACALRPDSTAAYFILAIAFHKSKQNTDSIIAYEQAIRLKPDFPQALNNLANLYKDEGQLEKAEATYREGIRVGSRVPVNYMNLFRLLEDQGRSDEAIEVMRKFTEDWPTDPRSHNLLGQALIKQGKIEEGIAAMRNGIVHVTDKVAAHGTLGITLRQLDKFDEAIEEFNEVLMLNAMDQQVHYHIGLTYNAKGELDKAIAEYRKAIDVKPNFAQAQNSLAWLLATAPDPNLRNSEEAVKWAEKAVKASPKNSAYRNTLGAAHYRHGELLKALVELTQSMSLQKSGGTANDFFFLSMTHSQLGDEELAHLWYLEGVIWMGEHQPSNAELERFRAEAATLLGFTVLQIPEMPEK